MSRAENTLKKAQSLIAAGEKVLALRSLYSVIATRRSRQWNLALESTMKLFIALCVELQKSKEAKDALHQFRSICQQTNMQSLGNVVVFFIEQAEDRVHKAVAEADRLASAEEEGTIAPEKKLLLGVGGETRRGRIEREVLAPWLKLLWEAYRTVLDILRNNNKLEDIYQETAQKALHFCLEHKRMIEFKRLNETLHNHLSNLSMPKWANQQHSVNLHSPDTLDMYLETRFVQLKVAIDLASWQEAFRSVEDIHGLLSITKYPLEPPLMCEYYNMLAKLFEVSGNSLFHAYSVFRVFLISKTNGLYGSEEETRAGADRVVLASLSVPLDNPEGSAGLYNFDDVKKDRDARLSMLLGPSVAHKRDALLAELAVRNITKFVSPELKKLCLALETAFNPLGFGSVLKPVLEYVAERDSLQAYAAPLHMVLFTRLLQRLERVYETISLEKLARLASFVEPTQLESFVVHAAKDKHVSVKIDHQHRCLKFGSVCVDADQVRSQLSDLASGLSDIVDRLDAKEDKSARARRKLFSKIAKGIATEREAILQRRAEVERVVALRQQVAELREQETEEERAARKEADARKVAEEKAAAVVPEVSEDEVKAQQLAEKRDHARKELIKMGQAARRMDYLVRALREESIPVLEAEYQGKVEQQRAVHEEEVKQFLENKRTEHKRLLLEKSRLEKMQAARAGFAAVIEAKRQEDYEVAKAEQDARMEVLRAKLEEQAAIDAERNRREEELRKKEEEEKAAERARLREAALKRAEEEDQRMREEAEAAEREQEAENKWRKPARDDGPARGNGRDRDDGPPRGYGRDRDDGPPRGYGRDRDDGPPRRFGRDRDDGPPRGYGRDRDDGPPRGAGRDREEGDRGEGSRYSSGGGGAWSRGERRPAGGDRGGGERRPYAPPRGGDRRGPRESDAGGGDGWKSGGRRR